MRTPVRRIEVAGGIFILLGIATLVVLLIFPGISSGRFLGDFEIEVRATDGLGLSEGNKVMMQGIQIGKVAQLRLDDSDLVSISCSIRPDYRDRIAAGSEVVLVPGTLFDTALVKVRPGKGKPLPEGTVFHASAESSVFDRVDEVADAFEKTLSEVKDRFRPLEGTLASLEKMLSAVNDAKGSLGKLLYEDEVYRRLVELINKLDGYFKGFDDLRARLDEFAQVLPEIKSDVKDSVTKIHSAADQLERGLAQFPQTAESARDALAEGRRVIESLKRNLLIRRNLPRDPESAGSAPASYREPPPVD